MIAHLIKQKPLAVLSQRLVEQLAAATERVERCPKSFDVSVVVVSNPEIQKYNRIYRKKNYPTDVLSFRYDQHTADIMISAQKVREQAAEYGNTLRAEAAFLVVHGILHALGWDHERSAAEARAMRKKEIAILSLCDIDCAR